MIILTGDWHPGTTKKVYRNFRIKLLKSLPMNDTLFLELLNKLNLLPGDLRARIHSKDTPVEKADWFLSNAIEPSLNVDNFESLKKLFIAMSNEEEFKSDSLKQLSAEIQRKLNEEMSIIITKKAG